MNNLVAFVSGGASGLGRATVQHFVRKGASVVFCDLATSEGAAVAQKVGPKATYIPADVTSERDVANVMAEIRSRHGRLHVVVNCAGIGNAHPTYNFVKNRPRNMANFEQIWKTNVMGTLNVNRLAVDLIARNEPDSKEFYGVIVNTAGIEGVRGTSGQAATAAASGAIIALTRALADDFQTHGIRVIAIAPGLLRTPLIGVFPPIVELAIANERVIAPNRIGHPNEYAHLVEMCVYNTAINGVAIELAGGLDLN